MTAMLLTSIDLDQARARFEDYAAEALRSRPPRDRVGPIRRAVGQRFIDLGRRIAAERPTVLASPRSPLP
jgi:hypothetical protein